MNVYVGLVLPGFGMLLLTVGACTMGLAARMRNRRWFSMGCAWLLLGGVAILTGAVIDISSRVAG